MSDRVIVKVKFEDDIRKAALPLSEINTFDAMANWIAETYNLGGTNNLMLKYRDEDNDLITMIKDDDLQYFFESQQKFCIHVFVSSDVTSSSNGSPTKTESVVVIHPSSHGGCSDHSSNEAMSLRRPYQHRHHQSQQSPSSQSTCEHLCSSSMNGMPSHEQQQLQQLPPSNPFQSANPQNYFPSLQQMDQQSSFPPTQQHQPTLFNVLLPPVQLHHEQSYPPLSATHQQFPPPSFNSIPLQHQQNYPAESAFQHQFAPPSSINVMLPPLNSGVQEHFASSPMNGMPFAQHQQELHMQQPPYFAPPQNLAPPPFVPGLSNPFARQ